MPIYEYRCENDHRFEAFQSMVDDSLDACEVCGAPAQRVLSAPALHFKGSGFYTTDYARKGKDKSGSDDGGEPKSDSDSSKSAEKKSDSSGSGSSNGSSNGSKGESKSSSGSSSKD